MLQEDLLNPLEIVLESEGRTSCRGPDETGKLDTKKGGGMKI